MTKNLVITNGNVGVKPISGFSTRNLRSIMSIIDNVESKLNFFNWPIQDRKEKIFGGGESNQHHFKLYTATKGIRTLPIHSLPSFSSTSLTALTTFPSLSSKICKSLPSGLYLITAACW